MYIFGFLRFFVFSEVSLDLKFHSNVLHFKSTEEFRRDVFGHDVINMEKKVFFVVAVLDKTKLLIRVVEGDLSCNLFRKFFVFLTFQFFWDVFKGVHVLGHFTQGQTHKVFLAARVGLLRVIILLVNGLHYNALNQLFAKLDRIAARLGINRLYLLLIILEKLYRIFKLSIQLNEAKMVIFNKVNLNAAL